MGTGVSLAIRHPYTTFIGHQSVTILPSRCLVTNTENLVAVVLELGLRLNAVVSWGHIVTLCPAPQCPNYCLLLAFSSEMQGCGDLLLNPRLTPLAGSLQWGHWEVRWEVRGSCRWVQGPGSQAHPSSRASSGAQPASSPDLSYFLPLVFLTLA